jgi:malonyl CoA-acyl carrier protein transacylase
MTRFSPIAVVGISALFPGSSDSDGFWRDILAGKDLLSDVPPTHWLVEDYYDPDPTAPDKTYCKRGGFLGPIDFDPLEFGVPPTLVPATDTSQLLALIVAQRVLDDASGGQFAQMDRERIGVILGVTSGQEMLGAMASRLQRPVWLKALRESGVPEHEAIAICERIAAEYTPWQEATFPGLLGNVVAGRIANRFDLRGTNCVVDAACASALSALAMAVGELEAGRSDLVITGGVDTLNDIFMYVCFSKTPALSPTGDCRPFSDAADGTMLGEGLAMVALKRLADAERDGDRPYAVIRGLGSSSDGRAKSVYAPVPEGQARAIRRAYEVAGYGPETVELVEAHGTGTKAGDIAEFAGLQLAFDGDDGRSRPPRQWCALGSVKSQIGHTKAAAGVAGLFKAVMALHTKTLPPTIKVTRPNPALDFASSPFYLNTAARPWIRTSEHPRRASVSSFGFGGSNFHVTLEEYVPRGTSGAGAARRPRAAPTELVLVSGSDSTTLARACRALATNAGDLTQIAHESQTAFRADAPCRLAIVASSKSDLSDKLLHAAGAMERSPDAPAMTPTGVQYGSGPAEGDVAFLFPGQGSQYIGMGADLAMALDQARSAWDAAARDCWEGTHLPEVVFPIPAFDEDQRAAQARRLKATEWAQPALGVASLALLNVLRALGVRPACLAGHSFGELTALQASGAFSAETLLALARRRGELMRDAAWVGGAMTAVAASIETVRARLEEWGVNVVVANHNAPTQVVLSGTDEAIAEVERRFGEAGVSSSQLPVATAFHSPLIAPSQEPFAEFLKGVDVGSPTLPVIGNADAQSYPHHADGVRKRLAAQLAQPVRFVEVVLAMHARGARTFVEVGPGSVLTDLVSRILEGRPHRAVALDRKGRHGMTSLQAGVGALAVAGLALDFAPLWESHMPGRAHRATKPGMALPILGTNYGKPYPPPGGAAALPPPNPSRAPVPPATPRSEAVPLAASPASDAQLAWVQAYQEVQRHTAEAHAAYQRATADTHAAYLRTAEASFTALAAMLGGGGASVQLQQPSQPSLPAMPSLQTAPPPAVEAPRPLPAPIATFTPSTAPSASAPAAAQDLGALLLTIVADKTGYPVEMLKLEMELEADLGVDSIKRVEILAAMRERVPTLSAVAPADMAALRTLGQIVERLRGTNGAAHTTKTFQVTAKLAPPARPAEPVKRFAVRLVSARASGAAPPSIARAANAVITDDGAGVAQQLQRALGAHGVRARVVDSVPADADAVVFLGGLRSVSTVDEAIAIGREAFRAARAIAGRFAEQGGTWVTVQDTGGDFGLAGADPTRAWLAGVAALSRTARHEWPAASVKAIDCARGGRSACAIADAIVTELFEGGREIDVALAADGARATLRHDEAAAGGRSGPVPPRRSTILVSGGARGVTAECLIALARTYGWRFVLLGRTPLEEEPAACRVADDEAAVKRALLDAARTSGRALEPSALGRAAAQVLAVREIRATLAAIAGAGGEARYAVADVTDAVALGAALAEARRDWGPVAGVIHGAGVLADRRIAEKTDEQFARVFDTKVVGLRAILEATAEDPLRLLAVFSSVAAVAGNAGQCDYAMANETLNAVACAFRKAHPEALVRALAWGPWEGGMVTPALAAHFRERGVALLPLTVGANLCVEELGADRAETVVVIGGSTGLGAAPSTDTTFVLRVDARSHPQLGDHRIGGVPVVPVVMVLEWFARAAHAARPDLQLRAVHGLKVLRGVRLNGFDREGDELTVACRQGASGESLELELRGAAGVHYMATVEMAADASAATPLGPAPPLEHWGDRQVYDGRVLFHGPSFQAIRALDGVSGEGVAGTLSGIRDLGWQDDGWRTDPAALDGALQLAILWSRHVLGAGTLPVAIESCRSYARGPSDGPLRAIVRRRTVHESRAVCDVALAGADGQLVAELVGVETVLRPDLAVGADA